MLPFIKDSGSCTGCGACYSICPVKSIKMLQNDEGFLYPEADDSCINCGKCERICPSLKPSQHACDISKTAYAALTKDLSVWKKSSSGGAFSEICAAWADGYEDVVFSGAAFDGFAVNHICVNKIDSIAPLRKSKYVQSNIGDTFIEIKNHLDNSKRVVFCGTPCQVAGLKAYLGRDYDSLLLIDLICHGVGSPTVFEACIRQLENIFDTKIKSYEFRSKRKTYELDYLIKIVTSSKGTIYLSEDSYTKLFLSQNALRASCAENCLYRNKDRQGDITIADFKGLFNVFPQLKGTKKNYSSIILNTKKGKSLNDSLKSRMDLLECSIDDIEKYNPLFSGQTWFSENRDEFFKDFINSPGKAIDKWATKPKVFKKSFRRKMLDLIPESIRKFLYKYK